jgi:hypothetical protein
MALIVWICVAALAPSVLAVIFLEWRARRRASHRRIPIYLLGRPIGQDMPPR